MDVVYQVCGGPRVAPGTWWSPLAGGLRTICLVRWNLCILARMIDVHFSQDPRFIPSYITYPCNGVIRPESFNPTKTKENNLVALIRLFIFSIFCPIPNAQITPGLADVVLRACGEHRAALRDLMATVRWWWGWGVPVALFTRRPPYLLLKRLGRPGDFHFVQRQCQPFSCQYLLAVIPFCRCVNQNYESQAWV